MGSGILCVPWVCLCESWAGELCPRERGTVMVCCCREAHG